MRYTIAKIGAASAFAVALVACSFGGQPAAGTQPTTLAIQPTATAVGPTSAAGRPQPTSQIVDAQPTAPVVNAQPTAPIVDAQPQPIIGFNPKAGGPGTNVDVFGSGSVPNEMIVVRLGLPQPLGEALGSAKVDGQGRWNMRVVIPDRLPSGELITSSDMRLVAMNDRNEALASAAFAFTPTPSDAPGEAAAATDAVGAFLDTVLKEGPSAKALSYLAKDQRGAIESGQHDIHWLLSEQNPFTGFTVDSFTASQNPKMPYPVVKATLAYGNPPQPVGVRQFAMVKEDGQWRIGAVGAEAAPVQDSNNEQAVRNALAEYINLLHTGSYREVAARYGGDYQALRSMNPDIGGDPTGNIDVQTLYIERACTQNGFACFQQRRIVGVTQIDDSNYIVDVELNNPDGSQFVLPSDGRAAFPFRVQRNGNGFIVLDLPPYVS